MDQERRAAVFIETARQRMREGDERSAIEFFSRALSFDPKRLDVHFDLAQLEVRRGDLGAAHRRLEAVAVAYAHDGHPDLAEDARRRAATLRAPEIGAPQAELTGSTEPMTIILKSPRKPPREKTICVKTLLRFPDGTIMPPQLAPTPIAIKPKKDSRPYRPGVGFRVGPPPAIRRPARR